MHEDSLMTVRGLLNALIDKGSCTEDQMVVLRPNNSGFYELRQTIHEILTSELEILDKGVRHANGLPTGEVEVITEDEKDDLEEI